MQPESTRDFKAEFDEFCSSHPTEDLFYRMGLLVLTHQEKTTKTNGRFKDQTKLGLDLLFKGCHDLNYIKKEHWPKYRSIQYITCIHNLKTIYSSYEKLVDGYYPDSATLARAPYEAMIKILFISIHPELDPYAIIVNRKTKGTHNFNLTGFLKDELKVDWSDYFLMSTSAHGNIHTILKEALDINQKGQTQPITPKIIYDQFFFEMGMNQLTFLVYGYLSIVNELFYPPLEKLEDDKRPLLGKIRKYIELRGTSIIESHPKPYWPQVIRDFKNIIDTIKLKEKSL